MHGSARTENLLGATALAVTDLMTSTSGAAAVTVLATSPQLSVTALGRKVGLTQSAAARMVDSLQASGLVERRPGTGREVAVALTPMGEKAAADLLAARTTTLSDVLATLDDQERATLDTLLAKLLTRLYDHVGDANLLCRLCDRHSCTTGAPCPVGQAERDSGA